MSNLPSEFINRIHELFKNKAEEILATFEHKKPTTFRINTLKISEELLKKQLLSQGFEFDRTEIDGAFVLLNKSQRELTETPEYLEGHIYIQGLSSMLPPLILSPEEKDLVLDACAAPGSKTTQMSAMMQNSGKIIANDMSRVRLYKLAHNLKTLGVQNTQTIHFRAQELWRKFPNTFDKVLCDVPCSLEGRFNLQSPKSYQNWSVKKVKVLANYQKYILKSAITCAKSGGTIVYSTCTISPEENEAVVDWVLKNVPGVTLTPISIKKIETRKGLTSWINYDFDQRVESCLRIDPTNNMEAFFVAKLSKL